MIYLKLDIGLLLDYYSSSISHRSLTDPYREEGRSHFVIPGQKVNSPCCSRRSSLLATSRRWHAWLGIVTYTGHRFWNDHSVKYTSKVCPERVHAHVSRYTIHDNYYNTEFWAVTQASRFTDTRRFEGKYLLHLHRLSPGTNNPDTKRNNPEVQNSQHQWCGSLISR